jgi:hypothetical protein
METPKRMTQLITRAALVSLLALSAAGCEHPSEPDESAELRAGIGGADREREGGERERAATESAGTTCPSTGESPAGPLGSSECAAPQAAG